MTASFFDAIYRDATDYYGHDMRPEFTAFIEGLAPDARVLEIGSGQGRHAIWVAETGRPIHAVDYSAVATEQMAALGRERGIPLTAECADAGALTVEPGSYDAVVMISLLSHLDAAIVPKVIETVHTALRPGGLVFSEAFTVDDPGFTHASQESETAEALTAYFAHGEIGHLFAAFRTVSYREFIEDDLAHGPAHTHGVALYVGAKV